MVNAAITSELQGVLIIPSEKSGNFCQNFSPGNIFTVFRRISNLERKMFVKVLPLDSKSNYLKWE